MTGAGLNGNLADTLVAAFFNQLCIEIIQIGAQFFRGAVLLADFTNFAADGDGDSFRFQLTDIAGKFHSHFKIQPLFFLYIRLAEIHEGGGVDIDIVKPCTDALADEVL